VRNLQRWLALDASGYAGMSGRARQCFAAHFHIQRGAERLVGIVGGVLPAALASNACKTTFAAMQFVAMTGAWAMLIQGKNPNVGRHLRLDFGSGQKELLYIYSVVSVPQRDWLKFLKIDLVFLIS